MYLNSLHIVQFKNYLESKIDFVPGFNLFAGLNGSGKTNLLDAIYYLSMTKSFFHNRDSFNVQKDKEFFRLVGNFSNQTNQNFKVTAKVQPGTTKVFDLNGSEYTQLIDHIGRIPIMMSAPSDIRIITDSSQIRRKYFDGFISQLDRLYLIHLISYNKYLRQRNALLKKPGAPDYTLLEVYTEKMAPSAQYIFEKRKEIVFLLQPKYDSIYQHFAGKEETSSFQYKSHLLAGSFLEISKNNLRKDTILHRTNIGIHRDDFTFLLNDSVAKQYASQGQIKSMLFSLHLSKHFLLTQKFGHAPILLLDDIFAKLDERRVGELMGILQQPNFGQIFISDTSEKRLAKVFEQQNISSYKTFLIDQGKVKNEFTNG